MALSRRVNGMKKDKERARRDRRMKEIIQAGKFPYTPAIMSWVSAKLDRPTTLIQPADVEKLLAAM
jgi:hypothetical protein